ncbi:hypothetical protein [Luteipulveratus mongoliensis]|nr:hypothetical protein [Luteipulveratus mongoliensis]
MPTVPANANAKKPADRKAKKVEETESPGDVRMSFDREGTTYESLPMEDALTADLIEQEPDPGESSSWQRMQFLVRLTKSAYRDDPVALEHIGRMSMREIGKMHEEVEAEAGVSSGE